MMDIEISILRENPYEKKSCASTGNNQYGGVRYKCKRYIELWHHFSRNIKEIYKGKSRSPNMQILKVLLGNCNTKSY